MPVIEPTDEHNLRLKANVAASCHINPEPSGRYNLVVVGAGTAGLVSALGAAGLGARVALIERSFMGGDCLNYGCVPSKGLIRCARAAHDARNAGEFGVRVPDVEVDFPAVMERMRRLRADISRNDSVEKCTDRGVDVFFGQGEFKDSGTLEVNGAEIKFAKAVIATGARAARLPIPGLEEVGYLTNETLFNLTQLPARLGVIGGGPIGCEMAQSFARFGSRVTQFEGTNHILSREDADAAKVLTGVFEREGIELLTNAMVTGVSLSESGKVVQFKTGDAEETREFDAILVAVGRAPNVEGLGLETIGVDYDPRRGVTVSDRLQTTNPRIFAAGDICSRYQFTHTADAAARIVLANALFFGRGKASAMTVPWTTYTDPEIAHVGMYTSDAYAAGIETDEYVQEFADVDRAILDGDTEGFAKVLVKKGTDRILGGTIVAGHAGEMLGELSLAVTNGLGLKAIGATIHAYPTQAEALKKLADAYSRTRLTPTVAGLFEKWLRWRR